MPARPGAGRPSKNTDERRSIILEAIQNKMPLYLAANYAKLDRTTLHRWIRQDVEFATQIEWAKAKAAGVLIDKVASDSNGAWKLLKNLQPDYFKDEQIQQTNQFLIQIKGSDGKSETINFGVESASGAADALVESSQSPSSSIGDTRGQDQSGSLVVTMPDTQDKR